MIKFCNCDIKKEVIISVDAGGTSTRYYIIDSKKEVLKKYKAGSGSPAINPNAENDIYNELKRIISENENIYQLKGIAIGMSGFALVNEKAYQERLEQAFNVNVIFENDAYMALLSVLKDDNEKGVVVISGTGAIILGKNEDKLFYANGWGELLTERGSGYSVVKDFVCEMIHHNEQRGYYTDLEQKFLDYLNFSSVEEFKMLFYRHKKNEVASFCSFFLEEAKKGNEEAKKWLYDNGTLLGIDVISCLKRVEIKDNFLIGFRGGFISDNIEMINGIVDKLKIEGYDPIIMPNEEPIFGGYYMAKKVGWI